MEAVKLMEAVEEKDLASIKELLKRRKFDMSAEEMDELLLRLPWTSLSAVEEFLSPRALLCIAAKKGEFAKVNWSLELKASSFASAAVVAAQHGHKSLAEKLFERSCKTDDKLWDSGVVLPLLYHAFQACSPINITMLKASKRQVLSAFMHFAAKTNDVDTLHHLLDVGEGNHVDFIYMDDGTTLLHRASHHGHEEVVKFLLEKGACMDKPDHIGRIPLHFATIQGHLRVVEVLLENDLKKELVNQQDHKGMTPLHLAACGGHVDVLRKLLEDGAKPEISTKKEGMSTTNYTLFLNTLLASCQKEMKGKPQNTCFRLNPILSTFWNPGGFTSLHFAVVYGGCEVTTELLKYGSEGCNLVSIKDTRGLTAYDWAQAKSSEALARVLEDLRKGISYECSFRREKAKGLMEECKKLEKMKKEVYWAEMMGWALKNGQWQVSQILAKKVCEESMNVSQMAWKHLEEASKVDKAIKGEWKLDKRKCLRPHEHTWMKKVEEVMLTVFKGNPSIEKVVLQDCLMWSLKHHMVDLAMEVAGQTDCDLMEETRGRPGGGIPLEFAATGKKDPWRLQPVLQAMEQRGDVRTRIFQDRQLYVDFLNAVLVASVLIAGVAFTSFLQPPASVKSFRESSTSTPGSSTNKPLVKLFVWSNDLSFCLAIVAIFSGICGAIPSPSGTLAYSKQKIQRASTLATLFIVGAVICHTFAFTAAALDLLAIHSKIRYRVRLFSIICGCASSIIIFSLLSRLLHVWTPIHKTLIHWGLRYHYTISFLSIIDTCLHYLHKLPIMASPSGQSVAKRLTDLAVNLCEGDTELLRERKRIWKALQES